MRTEEQLTTDPAAATDDVAGGAVARAALIGVWIALLAVYLSHAIVLSSDSINNHVHVWYIADRLWHHGELPWTMPVLAHGDAYAYPYGIVNWTTAALAWPLFGNWTVTLWTAIGAVGCLVATFVAFPELRRGWWAAAALANPAIVEALLFGQQSFAWAAMLLLFGIALWRRGNRLAAAIVVGVAQLTHAAVVLPIGVVLVALYLPFTRDRWAVVRWYALSCLIALPGVALVLASPTTSETSSGERALNFFITLGPRVLIVVLPLFYTLLRRTGNRSLAPVALAVSLVFGAAFEVPLNVGQQWHALFRRGADTATLDSFLHSPAFAAGATYRVLSGGDGKLAMYKVLRAGGRLDSEMFPEDMAIRSFGSVDKYAAALCEREVDMVLQFDTYDRARHTDEHTLLDALVNGAASTAVHARRVAGGPGWQAVAIDRSGCRESQPTGAQ